MTEKSARLQRTLSHLGFWVAMNSKLHGGLSVNKLRANFEKLSAVSRNQLMKKSPQLVFTDQGEGDLTIESLQLGDEPLPVVLYFHGGGYFMGSIPSYRHWALRLAYRCKVTVWTPEYRLAPEAPFPAALDDALTAYRLLLRRHPQRPVYFGGDSAGGGLALAALMRLRDTGVKLPKGAFLISPYADLTASSHSMRSNRYKDLWLSQKRIKKWAPLYHAATPADHPLVSPARGDFSGLPPLCVLVGADEVLLDDSLTIAENATACGVEVSLEIFSKMQHAWPIALPHLAESKAAVQYISDFLNR